VLQSKTKFSAIETNEIFEKEQRDAVIQKINIDFGEPSFFENKSGNTSIAGHTKWILEKKYVWIVNDFTIFLKGLDDQQKQPNPQTFNDSFQHRIQQVYLVGLECKELPYFQLMIYVQLSPESKIPVIIDSARLAVPFQIYLQNLEGLSSSVYEMSTIKPRFHMHHVVSSGDELQKGTDALRELISSQQNDKQFKLIPNEQSIALRELSLLQSFNLPTVMSAINFIGGILSFITHYEQFGGGGELQTCGLTIVQEHQVNVCIPEFDKQGIEKEIQMFSPNLQVFFSVTHAMNLHLFISGLLTWLSYFEITRNNMSEEIEFQREQIQNMLNNNNISNITDIQNKMAKIQGNYASMGMLLDSVKNQVIDQIDELSSRKGIFGISEIPIPQKSQDLFANTLMNRVGDKAYFELVAGTIKNSFSSIAEKLGSADRPTNIMTNFIYNQSSLKLQKTVKTNSVIEIILAVVIGIFTFVSIRDFFGF